MSSLARVILFVLLLVTAVVTLRAHASGSPVLVADDRTRAAVVIGWLIVVATPSLLVLLYAAARFRPPRRRATERRRGRSRAVPAVLTLAGLLVVAAVLAVLARLPSPGTQRVGGGLPERNAPTRPALPSEPVVGAGGSVFELAATSVAVALLLLLAVAMLRVRRTSPVELASTSPAGSAPPPLVTAAGEALAAVETSGSDPRAAIVGCFAAMERALADAPAAAPRPADAAADVLQRATEQGQLSPGTGDRLLGLFHEARYSTHPMTDADRGTAASTLRAILADLGRPRWRSS